MLHDAFQENVLLDSEGHIKVTDFGLAKHGMNDEARTNSFIGTMEVITPIHCHLRLVYVFDDVGMLTSASCAFSIKALGK